MANTRAFGSSSKSMSSSTDSSFWNEQARETFPGNVSRQKRRISRALIDSTSLGNCRLAAKKHLLQRVTAQAEAQRLEGDHLVGRNVAEVDRRPEVLHEPRLRRLRRRLEDEVVDRDLVDDLVDEPGAHLAGRPIDAGRPAFAALGDHLPGAGGELFLDPLDPLVRREDDVGVLRADLREDGEVARQVGDQLELSLARQVDHSVGDLDVVQAELRQPRLVLVDLVLHDHRLEERAADHDRLAGGAQHLELATQVLRDLRGAGPENYDVNERGG